MRRIRESIGPDHSGLALAYAALGLVSDARPTSDPDDLLLRITDISREVRARLPKEAGIGDKLFALNTCLFHDLAYARLRDRHDPGGLLLDQVLCTRTGHPAALAVLYMAVGRELGLRMRAVLFPRGCLLVRTETPAGPAFIDPAAGGASLSTDDLELLLVHAYGFENSSASELEQLLRGVDDRQVLGRLLAELERAYRHRGDLEKALRAADYVVSLEPESAAALRERARLLEQLDCHQAAREDYLRYLTLAPQADDSQQILRRLADLDKRRALLH